MFDHGYHAGLVIPREGLERFGEGLAEAWLVQFPDADWFEFGWGDAGFYFEVPTFDDVTLSIGARALLMPSPSVLHIATGRGSPVEVFAASDHVALKLSDQALSDVLKFVERSAVSPDQLVPVLYGVSAFYDGRGKYHLFQTCNSWVSQVLRAGGLASAPGPSVISGGLLWDLQRRYGRT
ncbi:DUF2459 domain-containing protein [Shimia marina]|uniref:DUF2459 domain-containing protein n=1 Tax=Shimia marina TaxID=321267 RepID=UPI00130D8999|nr:DUF2459 domain-containing protein [Shimia marina]